MLFILNQPFLIIKTTLSLIIIALFLHHFGEEPIYLKIKHNNLIHPITKTINLSQKIMYVDDNYMMNVNKYYSYIKIPRAA